MGSSVDGLVSGLSTSQLISQLMQAESAPQQRLKDKVTAENTALTAYQTVNTKLSSLKTAADALTSLSSWTAVKATSSSDAVVVTAAAGASAGDLTFNVTKVAKASVVTVNLPATGAVLATPGAGIDLTIGAAANDGTDGNPVRPDSRVTTHIGVTTDSVQGVADAINASGLGVRAAVVATDTGTMLQLTSTKTGIANQVAISGLSAPSKVAVAAQDAKIQIGDPAAGGYTVSSATNTFTNVISGVTLTVTKPENDVNLSVTSDAGGMADKMQALADAVNTAVTEIGKQTAYNATSKKSGPLGGDRTVRELANQVISAISAGQPGHAAIAASAGPPAVAASPAVPAYGSFATLGFSLDRYGKVSFDKTKFLAAYQADPAKIQSAVSDGLAKGLGTVAGNATNTTNGTLTTSVTGGNSYLKSLNTQVDSWDIRLASKQEGLQRQFSQLEVALGKMKDQSSWLSGQLASLK